MVTSSSEKQECTELSLVSKVKENSSSEDAESDSTFVSSHKIVPYLDVEEGGPFSNFAVTLGCLFWCCLILFGSNFAFQYYNRNDGKPLLYDYPLRLMLIMAFVFPFLFLLPFWIFGKPRTRLMHFVVNSVEIAAQRLKQGLPLIVLPNALLDSVNAYGFLYRAGITKTISGTISSTLFMVFTFIFGLFYLCSLFINPGFARPTLNSPKKRCENCAFSHACKREGDDRSFCSICRKVKEPDEEHCPYCSDCVRQPNFHSTFVGTCIGNPNVWYFTIMCLAAIVSLSCFIASQYLVEDRKKMSMVVWCSIIICGFLFQLVRVVLNFNMFHRESKKESENKPQNATKPVSKEDKG